jgi:hypothetical protein
MVGLKDSESDDDNIDEDSDEGFYSVVDVDEGAKPGTTSEYYIIPRQ